MFRGTTIGILFLSLLLPLFASPVLSMVQAIPAVSNDGNVTLAWAQGACSTGSSYRVNISKQVGSQAVSVATVSEPTFEYRLTNLANGTYQYNLQFCWTHPRSGYCSPPTPVTFTVNRNGSASSTSSFSAIASSNPSSVELNWHYSLYNSFLGTKDTTVSFSRNGDSKRYTALNRAGECGGTIKTTIADLAPGNYQFFLDICGKATKTTTTKTCAPTKTTSITISGETIDFGDSPQPVPNHGNVIELPFTNNDTAETLTATTAGALSVDNGTATYTVPIKLPPAASALMPGLALQYNSNKSNVNDDIAPAGFGWNITGFSSVSGCEGGYLKDCKKKLAQKETFIQSKVLHNTWFQPRSVTRHRDPSGTQYWYGENGFGQGSSDKQLSKVEDVYGNRASIHYRPDGRIGFIYFNSQDAVIFEYANGYVRAVTTYIESSLENPSSGQPVSRYELTHGQSISTDNQLLQSIRECGFDGYGSKACAKPLAFTWTKGQFGFQSSPHSVSCPAGTDNMGVMTGDIDGDGYSDNYMWASISWGKDKQGCGNWQEANGDLRSTDELGQQTRPSLLRTKDGNFLFHNMKLYRPSKTQHTTLFLSLFDVKAFVTPGKVDSEYPLVTTLIDDFNADGLDDVYYGGSYWHQNPTSPPSFTWDGKQPKYDRDNPTSVNMTYESNEYTGERKVGLGYRKPRDINGDGKIDFFTEFTNFNSGIDSFDYNKDGRTDAFYIKDGDFVFDLNIKNGNEFIRANKPFSAFNGIAADWAKEQYAATEISYGRFNLFPGDWTGDGVPDAFLAKANGPYAGLRGKPDLLEKITDGFGAQTTLSYDTLHGDLVDGKVFYSPASVKPKWPYEHTHRSMNVVKKVGHSNGTGGFTYEQYYYQGGIYNVAKREFMAFEKITRILPDHGLVETTYYDHKIPFNGTVLKSESKTTDGKWISRVTNHYVTHPDNTRFIYNDYSIAEDFKLQSKPISVTKVTNTFDRYGTLLTSESVTGTGLSGTDVTGILQRTRTENIPEHDPDQWLLGFITSTTSTTEHGNGTDRRTYTHEYVREPDTVDVQQSTLYVGTDVEVTTTYIRDQRSGANPGVVTETHVSARDTVAPVSAERGVSLADFENGIYPMVSYNSLGHETRVAYDKRFGKTNYTRDGNGLESTTVFDPLGRNVEAVSPTGVVTVMESYFCGQSPYSCPEHGAYVSLTRSTHPNSGSNLAAPLTVKFYDSLQRVIRTQTQSMNGTWVKQDTHYDEFGRVEQISEPFTTTPQAYTSYTNYNALGEALLVINPDGSSAELSHTLSNSLYVSTLTNNLVGSQSSNQTQTHTTRINALGQTHEVTDSGGISTRYFYNSQGHLEGTRVNNNEATRVSIEYDVAGNKTGITDPAAGRIDYVYNGFGEVRKQIWQLNTVNEKSMRFDYDGLGRQVKRVDSAANGTTSTNIWRYDVEKRGTLYSETDGNSWTRVYSYDGFTRPSKIRESFGDGTKSTSFTYDSFSRPETVTYPNGTVIKSYYSARGIHYQTMDATAGRNKVLWQLYDTIDGRGHYRYTKLGNNVVVRKNFDPVTGHLEAITSGKVASGVTSVTGTLQNLGYEWDSIGNLQHRTSQRVNSSGSQIENIIERFSYDNSNRLQYAETSGVSITPRTRDYEYDTYGNVIHNGRGSQQYAQMNGASLYGVTRANSQDYHYDAYGNVTRRGTTNLTYNVFNKPTNIGGTQFWYDANHQKVKQQTSNRTTYFYASGAYEVENNNGTVTTTLRVGNYVQKKTGTTTTEEYHLFDHLGSTDVITDANGALRSRMAFDALGNRLNDSFASSDSTSAGSDNYKGYTGHDMLDHLGLIHMGGRVYDPDAGRFLSADLFVQNPFDSQSYNRYSYVRNRPLNATDPSGYSESEYLAGLMAQQEAISNYAYMAGIVNSINLRLWAREYSRVNMPGAPPNFLLASSTGAGNACTDSGNSCNWSRGKSAGTVTLRMGGGRGGSVPMSFSQVPTGLVGVGLSLPSGGTGSSRIHEQATAYQTSFGDGQDDSDLKFTSGLQAGARIGLTKLLGAKLDLDFVSHEISLLTGKNFANQSFALSLDVAGFSLGFDASRNVEFGRLNYGENSILGILSGHPFDFKPVFSTPWNVSAKEFWRLDFGASAIFGIEGTVDLAQ